MKTLVKFSFILFLFIGFSAMAQTKKEKKTKVETHTDPVCKMTVKSDAKWQHSHDGKVYYFCNPSCKERFAQKPEKYLK